MIKKIFRYAVIGMLIGSLTFLLILLFSGTTLVTPQSIISNLAMSAGIGLVSMIFEIEWNMLLEIVIHFLVTLGLVTAMCFYNGFISSVSVNLALSLLGFVMIYVMIWLGLYLFQLADMKRLNRQIELRKRGKQQ